MKLILPFLLVGGLFVSCLSCASLESVEKYSPTYIKQNDDFYLFLPFYIVFKNREYSSDEKYVMQIAALSDVALYNRIMEGMNIKEIPVFRPGTGMAFKNGELVVINSGHHYIFFTLSDTSRVTILKENPNQLYTLEYPVNNLVRPTIPLANSARTPIYLVLLNDRNLNTIIDAGELIKVVLYVNQ